VPAIFASYVSSECAAKLFYGAGCRHFIVDSHLLSYRAHHRCELDSPLKINQLIEIIYELYDDVTISLNIDFVVHNADFSFIESVLNLIDFKYLSAIRAQDIGLLKWLRENIFSKQLILQSETRFLNTGAITVLRGLDFVEGLSLSNSLSKEDIKAVTDIDKSFFFELQLHGAILLQYSKRRYLDGDDGFQQGGYRKEGAGKQGFLFRDNQFGTAMFHYFERALYKHLTLLKTFNLSSFLFDFRNGSLDRASKILSLYHLAYCSLVASGVFNEAERDYLLIKETSSYPLKPGFFMANRTDQDMQSSSYSKQEHSVAFVCDVIKKKFIVLRAANRIDCCLSYDLIKHDGKRVSLSLASAKLLNGDRIDVIEKGMLFKLPSVGGVQVKAVLVEQL
jgi:collagenase-like PrtC family protease